MITLHQTSATWCIDPIHRGCPVAGSAKESGAIFPSPTARPELPRKGTGLRQPAEKHFPVTPATLAELYIRAKACSLTASTNASGILLREMIHNCPILSPLETLGD